MIFKQINDHDVLANQDILRQLIELPEPRSHWDSGWRRSSLRAISLYMSDHPEYTSPSAAIFENTVQWLQLTTSLPEVDIRETVRQALYDPDAITERYKVYRIPKKDGGVRVIEAPDITLKTIQRAILHYALDPARLRSPKAMGFVPHRSIITNAIQHQDWNSNRETATGRYMLKMDMKDFFPSITLNQLLAQWDSRLRRTAGMLSNGALLWNADRYPGSVQEIVKRIPNGDYGFVWNISNPARYPHARDLIVAQDLITWLGLLYLCVLDDRLPQGAPTSPALSNAVYAPVDAAIANVIHNQHREDIVYTRYADDIIITAGSVMDICRLKAVAQAIIGKVPNAVINPKKTHILRHGHPMRVTGININHVPSISRTKRDGIRQRLFIINKEGKVTDKDKSELIGHRAFMRKVDMLGWDARCEILFQKMLELPVERSA